MDRLLRELQTRASMMMVTAHPDDEDGGTLAFESRGNGVRTTLMTLNRGEGGQNAMSSDMYDALGLVRTQELLAADRYYGVDQYWGSVVDYGFSKTREEALEKWDHDRVLSDVVRVIRMTRPLVITSVFVGAASDGHGQHQVSGQMAQEAYLAAGDPAKFPEQIREGLRPWTPLKVYAHVPFFELTPQGMYDYAIDKYVPPLFHDYVTGISSDKKPAPNVAIDVGKYNPAVGLTYLQVGRAGLGEQKSQNNGISLPPPYPMASEYHRYGARVPAAVHEESFFDGIDTSVNGIGSMVANEPDFLKAGLEEMAGLARQAASEYRADRPQGIAPVLAAGLTATRGLAEKVRESPLADPGKSDVVFELGVKEGQFEQALAESLGLSLEAVVSTEKDGTLRGQFWGPSPTFTMAVPGQSFYVQVELMNRCSDRVQIGAVKVAASDGKAWKIGATVEPKRSLGAGEATEARFAVTTPADASLTRPYFTRPDEEQAYYDLRDPRYRNLSLAPYPLAASAEFTYRGATVHLAQVVQAMQRVAAMGIVAQPLLVGPAISVTVSPAAGAVPVGAKSFAFTCTVHSNVKGTAEGVLRLELPSGWHSTPEAARFAMSRDGEDRAIAFEVEPDAVKPGDFQITADAEYQGKHYREGYRLAGYPGLRPYPFYRPAIYKAVGVDVKTAPGLHIGYLPGTGDDVPQALENLGLNVRTLSAGDVTQGNLSGYDAVVLGVRAYVARPELKSANHRMLEYVKNGGVLIVQYNLQDFDQNYGPYPFTLGSNPQKVVDENAPVKILKPDSPVLSWPNRITPADFSGWVEERGHGFLQKWDAHYEALVETHDPEQDPQLGGLLVARYGKGAYIYDAFALYRQLPSGVPGAYRILANLVSLGKNPKQ